MRFITFPLFAFAVALSAACSSDEDSSGDPSGSGGTSGTGTGGSTSTGGSAGSAAGGSGGSGAGGSAGSSGAAGSAGSAAGGSAGACAGSAGDWIAAHFAGAELVSGDHTSRTTVETPALVKDATGCCAKYAFDVHEESSPDDPQVGFVNVTIKDLESNDAYGGGIQSSSAPGLVLFLDNVLVEPNWPMWESYSTTNKDGLVLDDAAAIYAEDLTIKNWNADGAIDNKAPISQFVRLTFEGQGHRGMRYWGAGPHYLVESNLNNAGGVGEGSLLWFQDCDGAEVRIYDSTFNGSPTVPESLVSCDNGNSPNLVYLTTDPRTTGEMHEMFAPCAP